MRGRPAGVGLGVGALLLGATACTSESAGEPAFSAPAVYYVRPYGDEKGVEKKTPVPLEVKHLYRGGGNHRLTVDVEAGSQDTVRLREKNPGCSGSASHVTCTVSLAGALNYSQNVLFTPVAVKGSKAGEAGFLRYTYETEGGKTLTARTKVVVGEPVVEVWAPKALEDVRPGAEIAASFVVRNTGEVPVRGVGLEIGLDKSWKFAERYANCRYPAVTSIAAVCEFPDLRIAPGQSAVIRPALRIRPPKTRMYGAYLQKAWPLDVGPGEYSAWLAGGDSGDGPALTAVVGATGTVAGGVEARGPGTFVQGGRSVPVSLALGSDYEVSDIDLRGEPGTERTLKVTVRNNGPGDPGAAAHVMITPPPGAQVLKEPMQEIDEDAYEPLCDDVGSAYKCAVESLEPGESHTFGFTLRVGETGVGQVRIEDDPEPADPSAWRNRSGRRDPDPSNDQALIRVLG